jgi:hypothetical protein
MNTQMDILMYLKNTDFPMYYYLNDNSFPNDFKVLKNFCDDLPIIKKDNRFGILYYNNKIEEKVKELPNLLN